MKLLNCLIAALLLSVTGLSQNIKQSQVRGLPDSLAARWDSTKTAVVIEDSLFLFGLNMPSDTTGLPEGTIYYDENGFLKRKTEQINIDYNFGNDTLIFAFDTDSVNTTDNNNLMLYLAAGTHAPSGGLVFIGATPEYRAHYNGWGGSYGTTAQPYAPALSMEQDAHWGMRWETNKSDSAGSYRFMKHLGSSYNEYEIDGDMNIVYSGGTSDNWFPVTGLKFYKNVWNTVTWTRDNRVGRHIVNGVSESSPVPNTLVTPTDYGQYFEIPTLTYQGSMRNFRYWLIGTVDTFTITPPMMTAFNRFGEMTVTKNTGLGTVTFDYTGNDKYQIYELYYEGTLPADFRSFPNTAFSYDYKLSGDAFVTAVIMLDKKVFAISDTSSVDTDWTAFPITRAELYYPNTHITAGTNYRVNPLPSYPYTVQLIIYVKNGSVSIRNTNVRYMK